MSGKSELRIKTVVLEGPPGCHKRLVARKLNLLLGETSGWMYLPLFEEVSQSHPQMKSLTSASLFRTMIAAPLKNMIFSNGPLFYVVRLVGDSLVINNKSGFSIKTSFLRGRTDIRKEECLFIGLGSSQAETQLEEALKEDPSTTIGDLATLNRLYAKYYDVCKADMLFIDVGRCGPFTAAKRVFEAIHNPPPGPYSS